MGGERRVRRESAMERWDGKERKRTGGAEDI